MATFTQSDYDEMIKSGAIKEDDVPGDVVDGAPPSDDEVIEAAAAGAPPQETTPEPVRLNGEGVPDELKGKTLEEALGIYNEVKNLSSTLAKQIGAPKPTPQAPPPPPAKTPTFSADDLVEDGGAGFMTKMEQFYEAKTAPLVQALVTTTAHNMRSSALAQSPVLKKYEATLDKLIEHHNLQPAGLAQPQTWTVLEAMVQQAHVDDIVRERMAAATKPEPELTAGSSTTPEVGGKPGGSLTAEEMAVARALNVPYAVYAQMKPYTNQG